VRRGGFRTDFATSMTGGSDTGARGGGRPGGGGAGKAEIGKKSWRDDTNTARGTEAEKMGMTGGERRPSTTMGASSSWKDDKKNNRKGKKEKSSITLASAPRESVAIVKSQGKKVLFDD